MERKDGEDRARLARPELRLAASRILEPEWSEATGDHQRVGARAPNPFRDIHGRPFPLNRRIFGLSP
jgi:hypothetical protein